MLKNVSLTASFPPFSPSAVRLTLLQSLSNPFVYVQFFYSNRRLYRYKACDINYMWKRIEGAGEVEEEMQFIVPPTNCYSASAAFTMMLKMTMTMKRKDSCSAIIIKMRHFI